MTRTQDEIERLKKAPQEILELLANGPIRTSDLIVGLDYDPTNFMLTQWIGDRAGHWDDSAHQLALNDLLDAGKVECWRDEQLDVWYGLAGSKPERTGDAIIAEFFKQIEERTAFVAQPREDIPCELVTDKEQLALSVENGMLEIYAEYDCSYRTRRVPWPIRSYDEVATLIELLGQWSAGLAEIPLLDDDED